MFAHYVDRETSFQMFFLLPLGGVTIFCKVLSYLYCVAECDLGLQFDSQKTFHVSHNVDL